MGENLRSFSSPLWDRWRRMSYGRCSINGSVMRHLHPNHFQHLKFLVATPPFNPVVETRLVELALPFFGAVVKTRQMCNIWLFNATQETKPFQWIHASLCFPVRTCAFFIPAVFLSTCLCWAYLRVRIHRTWFFFCCCMLAKCFSWMSP